MPKVAQFTHSPLCSTGNIEKGLYNVGENGGAPPFGEHRPPYNIRKSIHPIDITECSQTALYHQKPIWKVNLTAIVNNFEN